MDAHQKHLSQSRCRASPEPLLFQALTKHTQCNSITHTGRHMGQIKQGSEYRRAPAPGSAAPPTELFRRPSLSVGTWEGWRMTGEESRDFSPGLNSRFKFKCLVKFPEFKTIVLSGPHSCPCNCHFYQTRKLGPIHFFWNERTLSPLCLSFSFPPLKNTFCIFYFLYKWFSHTANINI